MTATRKRFRAATALAAAFVIAATLMTPVAAGAATEPASGTATSRMPGTYLESGSHQASTDFFVYLNAGERIHARFSTINYSAAGGRVDITNPRGNTVYDVTTGAAEGSAYGGSWQSADTGVWRVRVFDAPDGGHARLDWSIAATTSTGTSIPGRVWSESIAFFTIGTSDLSLFTLNEGGSEYRVDMDDYDGIDSTVAMNNIGNAVAGTCEPALVSVPETGSPEGNNIGAQYWQPRRAGDCPELAPYRLFLDRPDQNMPTSTALWADGRTADRWLHSRYVDPSVSLTSFTRNSPTAQAGTLRGRLDGQHGEVAVSIDVDGDGNFSGSRDVTDSVTVGRAGSWSMNWDGYDAQRNRVSVSKAVNFRAEIAQVAPIHFVRMDAERSGGLRMTAVEGPSTGSATMYWNDTLLLATSGSRYSSTSILDGAEGYDSSSFRHGWAGDDSGAGRKYNANDGVNGSHGDMRSIDDWTFQEVSDSDTLALAPQASGISIRKSIEGNDANAAPGARIATGAQMRIDFTVTNTGSQSLTGVRVSDSVYGAVTCPSTNLAPAQSVTCSITRPAPAPGVQHMNTGTVVATDEAGKSITADDVAYAHVLVEHGLRVDKSPATLTQLVDGRWSATWDVTVSNAGNVAATGVAVTDWASDGASFTASKRTATGTSPDALTSPTSFTAATATSQVAKGDGTQRTYELGTLQPGTSAQLRVTSTYWPDVDSDTYAVNMAWAASDQQSRTAPAALPTVTASNYSASGVSVAGCTAVGHDGDRCDTTPARITEGAPALTVDKSAPSKSSRVHGESVTWAYTVRNTGTTQATGVTLSDDRLGTIAPPARITNADGTTRAWNGVLRPGESAVFTATGPIYRVS